jgi:AcrR family transcriptional regulator
MRNSDARERILETASNLFYRQGYIATGINQIIKESGVAKTTLYEHFHAKEDLLIEYLTNMSARTDEWLKAEADKYDSPKEKILGLFDFLIELSSQAAYCGCGFLNIVSELPSDGGRVKAIIKKQKDNVRALFADILRPLKKEQYADHLYMLFDGALITNKVHSNPWPIQTAKEMVDKILS